jgi:hypothetical protein
MKKSTTSFMLLITLQVISMNHLFSQTRITSKVYIKSVEDSIFHSGSAICTVIFSDGKNKTGNFLSFNNDSLKLEDSKTDEIEILPLKEIKFIKNKKGILFVGMLFQRFKKDDDKVLYEGDLVTQDEMEKINLGLLKKYRNKWITKEYATANGYIEYDGRWIDKTMASEIDSANININFLNADICFQADSEDAETEIYGIDYQILDFNGDKINDFMVTGKTIEKPNFMQPIILNFYEGFGSRNSVPARRDRTSLKIRYVDTYKDNSITKIGDFNGDGCDDILLCEYEPSLLSGIDYFKIILGNDSVFENNNYITYKISFNFKFNAISNSEKYVIYIYDLNRDGKDDIIVSCPGAGFYHEGKIYIMFGNEDIGSIAKLDDADIIISGHSNNSRIGQNIVFDNGKILFNQKDGIYYLNDINERGGRYTVGESAQIHSLNIRPYNFNAISLVDVNCDSVKEILFMSKITKRNRSNSRQDTLIHGCSLNAVKMDSSVTDRNARNFDILGCLDKKSVEFDLYRLAIGKSKCTIDYIFKEIRKPDIHDIIDRKYTVFHLIQESNVYKQKTSIMEIPHCILTSDTSVNLESLLLPFHSDLLDADILYAKLDNNNVPELIYHEYEVQEIQSPIVSITMAEKRLSDKIYVFKDYYRNADSDTLNMKNLKKRACIIINGKISWGEKIILRDIDEDGLDDIAILPDCGYKQAGPGGLLGIYAPHKRNVFVYFGKSIEKFMNYKKIL